MRRTMWWRCHRRIIADYLIAQGREVFHLMDEAKVVPARSTPGMEIVQDGVIYPPLDDGQGKLPLSRA